MKNEVTVESIINKEERIKLYNIVYIGVSAYSRLLDENAELIKAPSFKEIKTRLLNFVIKRQFENDILALDFPYEVEFKDVNHFGNIALFLNNNKTKIQVNKTSKVNRLYNSTKPSQYMLDEAKRNSTYSRQIQFFTNSDDEIGAKEDKRTFMILGYGVKYNKVDHLDFIIPTDDMHNHIDSFNGLLEYNELTLGIVNDNKTEERIIALKEEALRVIK